MLLSPPSKSSSASTASSSQQQKPSGSERNNLPPPPTLHNHNQNFTSHTTTTKLNNNNKTPTSLKVFTGTWNCAEYNPEVDTGKLQYDMLRLLQFNRDTEENDIYVIGLQEIQMNATSMVKEETIAKSRWQSFFRSLFDTASTIITGKKVAAQNHKANRSSLSNMLDSMEEGSVPAPSASTPVKPVRFKEIGCYQLVGILIVIYVKEEHFLSIKNEACVKCREGALGVMGNKGSVAFRFKLYDRTFLFISMHLSAHMKNVEQRNQNLNNILSKTVFRIRDVKQLGVEQHDFIFLLGDFNYRIQPMVPEFNDIVQKIEDDNLSYLTAWDQCQTEKRKGTILKNFEEGEINFPPTFKFKIGTDEYNPKRIPSWCDRIFFQSRQALLRIEQVVYGSSPTILSDHKPVFSLFEVPLDLPGEFSAFGSSNFQSARALKKGRPKVRLTPARTTVDLDDLFCSSGDNAARRRTYSSSPSNMFSSLDDGTTSSSGGGDLSADNASSSSSNSGAGSLPEPLQPQRMPPPKPSTRKPFKLRGKKSKKSSSKTSEVSNDTPEDSLSQSTSKDELTEDAPQPAAEHARNPFADDDPFDMHTMDAALPDSGEENARAPPPLVPKKTTSASWHKRRALLGEKNESEE